MTTWPLPEDGASGRAPLRGREAELAFMEERLDALAQGEGGVALVEGPAGSGKSRFLAEASASARRRGTRVFQGGADPEEQFVPLAPLLDGLLSGEEPLPDAARLRDLATVPGQRFWLLQELGDRLQEAARGRPLLIVLDDLQWCDELTLLTFHTVAARLAAHPILWLVAVRGGSVPPSVRTTRDRIHQGGAHELTLGPLGDEAIAQIAEDVLGAVPDRDVLRVARRAQGVPLLLVELLDALRDEEVVAIDNGTARLTAEPVPLQPLPSVGRRLALLSDAARELVETAAAAGHPLTVGLLAELLGRSPAALITAVRESLDADVLVERGDRLEFRHALVREAVEAGLPLSVRRTLRGHAAELLSQHASRLLAEHAGAPPVPEHAPSPPVPEHAASPPPSPYAASPLPSEYAASPPDTPAPPAVGAGPGDRAAVDRLRTAAAELAATAPGSAADLSLSALERTAADAPERPRVIAETIPLLGQTGQAARAKDLGAAALSTGGLRPEDEARIRLGLARLAAQFDFCEAVRQARAGAALPGIPTALRAQLRALLCLGLSLSGADEAAEQALAEALEAAEAADDRASRATLAVVESVLRFRRMDWSEALRQADRAIALATGPGTTPSLWIPEALWQGLLLNAAGRSAAALAVAEAGVRSVRSQGHTVATRMWLMLRTRVLLDAGRLTDARADAEAAYAMTDELGPGHVADVVLLPALLRTALHTNDQQAAHRYAAQAGRMRTDSAPLVRDTGAWMLALLADFEGRPDRAMAALDDVVAALDARRPFHGTPADPADAPVLVRWAVRAGAHEPAALAVAVAERRAAANPDFTLLAATAAHARGLHENDLEHLLRAVRLYEDGPRPMARASALEDAGRKLAVTRRAEAVPYLDKALDLYTRAGAERDVARVRRRLRAAGVRRRPSTAGYAKEWPELTASELGVARLVAQGLTNPQVAERLSVSPHTVSAHLRRAFTKLDITSRTELARLVERRDNGE
ncbi:AAA family ATPase [Streptomyces sp. NPDC059063]|uniref:helix-turn-helix transcriptional regulator n=1 Tax=unclassified Streptomyces TaxID=2593676 RepID=UPI0036CDC73B